VFIVYAFDSTTSTPAYKKVDEIFWMVHKELTKSVNTSLGYIYVMSTPNTYTLDMKLVDPADKDGSYKGSSAWRRTACTKNMASGLYLANEFLSNHGKSNSIILLFADGLGNMGDFFDGSEGFVSKFPVHTFTVDGDADSKVYMYSIRDRKSSRTCVWLPKKILLQYLFCVYIYILLDSPHHHGEFRRDVQPSPGS
jgi:hypothetical protein